MTRTQSSVVMEGRFQEGQETGVCEKESGPKREWNEGGSITG